MKNMFEFFKGESYTADKHLDKQIAQALEAMSKMKQPQFRVISSMMRRQPKNVQYLILHVIWLLSEAKI